MACLAITPAFANDTVIFNVYWRERHLVTDDRENKTHGGARTGSSFSLQTEGTTWVLPETTSSRLSCGCGHLSDFVGQYFVPPNNVNLLDLELYKNITHNYVVLALVLSAWFLHICLSIWAYTADRKDRRNRTVTRVVDDTSAHYAYLLTIFTGMKRGAGTKAYVSMCISGDKGTGVRHKMRDSTFRLFEDAAEDWFIISEKRSLGNLNSVTVWVDYTDTRPSWFLNQITVHDFHNGKMWNFVCDAWLTPSRGVDVAKTRMAHTKKVPYGYSLGVTSKQNLRDQHLWLSIWTCPRHSTFTRVQRISCGFAFIMSSMLMNIIFFGVNMSLVHENLLYESMQVGLGHLIIGLQCALFTVPINMLIVMIFRNVETRDLILGERAAINYETRRSSCDVHVKGDFNDDTSSDDDDDDDDDNYSSNNKGWDLGDKDDGSGSNESDVEVIPPFRLPWWFIYIGWTITITMCILSSFIVLKYGLTYGYNKSVAWIASFVTAATTNIGLMQPLKVAAIAVVMTFMFRSPVMPATDFTYLIMYEPDLTSSANHRRSRKWAMSTATV